jgi:hypothetical protein
MASTIDFNRNAIANMNKEKIALKDAQGKEIESYKAVDQQYRDLEARIDARNHRTEVRKDRERDLKKLRIEDGKSEAEGDKINKDLFYIETELGLQKTKASFSPKSPSEHLEYDLWVQNMENEKLKKELEIRRHEAEIKRQYQEMEIKKQNMDQINEIDKK